LQGIIQDISNGTSTIGTAITEGRVVCILREKKRQLQYDRRGGRGGGEGGKERVVV